jgi:hypothetical protein
MEVLLQELGAQPESSASIKALADVAIAMEKPAAMNQAALQAALREIAKAAHSGVGSLDKCIAEVANNPLSAATINKLKNHFDSEDTWKQVTGWDDAAQRYLALVPLYQSWAALSTPPLAEQQDVRTRIDGRFTHLKFRPGLDSPGDFAPSGPVAQPGQ